MPMLARYTIIHAKCALCRVVQFAVCHRLRNLISALCLRSCSCSFAFAACRFALWRFGLALLRLQFECERVAVCSVSRPREEEEGASLTLHFGVGELLDFNIVDQLPIDFF